jgi:hypothetical protein
VKRTSLLGGREGRRQKKNRRLLTIDRYRSQKEMKIKFKKQNKKHQKCFGRRKKELKQKNRTKNKIPEWGSQNTINHTHSCFYSFYHVRSLVFYYYFFLFSIKDDLIKKNSRHLLSTFCR